MDEILSRKDSSKKMADILNQLPLLDAEQTVIDTDSFNTIQNLAHSISAQISFDPRTKAFLDAQTIDYHEAWRATKPKNEILVGALTQIKKEISEMTSEDFEKMCKTYTKTQNFQSRERTPLYRKILGATQEAFSFSDGIPQAVPHMVASIAFQNSEDHFEGISNILVQAFWDARMAACKKIGYDSEEIIPDLTSVDKMPGLKEAISLSQHRQSLAAFGLNMNQLLSAEWQQEGNQWHSKISHQLDDCYSSKYFPKSLILYRQEGLLYSLETTSKMSSGLDLYLSKTGQLRSSDHVVNSNESIAPDGFVRIGDLKETELVYTGKHLTKEIEEKLHSAYKNEVEHLSLSLEISPKSEWFENYLPNLHALRLVKYAEPFTEKAKEALQDEGVTKKSILAHQLKLFVDYSMNYSKSRPKPSF